MVEGYKPDVIADRRRILAEGFVSSLVPFVGGGLVSAMRINKPLSSEEELLRWIEEVTVDLNRAAEEIGELDKRDWASGVVVIEGGILKVSKSHNISSITDEGVGKYFISFASQPRNTYQVNVQIVGDGISSVENSLDGFRVRLKSPDQDMIDAGFYFQVRQHRQGSK